MAARVDVQHHWCAHHLTERERGSDEQFRALGCAATQRIRVQRPRHDCDYLLTPCRVIRGEGTTYDKHLREGQTDIILLQLMATATSH